MNPRKPPSRPTNSQTIGGTPAQKPVIECRMIIMAQSTLTAILRLTVATGKVKLDGANEIEGGGKDEASRRWATDGVRECS